MKRKKYIEKSIDKWETIETELLGEQKRPEKKCGWIANYWNTCGYCDYYEGCSDCPLLTKIGENFVCFGDYEDIASHASITLSLADIGEYKEALEHCQIVLDFMRTDLENNKDREFSMVYCTKCTTPMSIKLNEIPNGGELTCTECEHEGVLTPPDEGDSSFYSSYLEKEVKIIGKF